MFWRMMKIAARQQYNAYLQKRYHHNAERHADNDLTPIAKGYALPETREFSINGPSGDYRIFVAIPPAPPPPEGYPVLFLLDANACFGTALDTLRLQSPWPEVSSVKPVVLVGIGYPGEATFDHQRRSYDFTPVLRNPTWRSNFVLGLPWNKPGGADAFLSFLTRQLTQILAQKYSLNLQNCHLCGLSLGGFFALYALVKAPEAFRSVIGVSSALWWDNNRIIDDLTTLMDQALVVNNALVVVGEAEIPSDPPICQMMRDQSRAAVEALNVKGCNASYLELAGENHQSCIMAAMPAILRYVCR